VHRFNPFLWRSPQPWCRLVQILAVAWFLLMVVQYYIPGKGFSCLIFFGGASPVHRVRELQGVDYYVYADSNGYDGQYYAQLAVKPLPQSRDLAQAMDNLPYRARRILFSATAYVLGLGRPGWVLQAYALQNILAWLLLAWLLQRWFPPTSLGNLVRWAGTLFAWGLTMSVREALMDGPSLLLIAGGMALAEQGRTGWSVGVLGLAGLGRETNVLAAVALAPDRDWNRREVLRAAGRIAWVFAPLIVWIGYLWTASSELSNAGAGNFAAPFTAFFNKWYEAVREYRAAGWDSSAKWTFVMLVSLSVQFLVIVLRPRWDNLWWRVGAAYAGLLVLLGPSVWDGFPGAASRVVVPMTLAFNIVAPRGWRWWPLLVLGNLSALSAPDQLRAPGQENFAVEGPENVWMTPTREGIVADFAPEWYQTEKSHFEYWRWSRGPAGMVIQNPQSFPVEVELRFGLRAFDERTVRVFQGGTLRWQGTVDRVGALVTLPHVRLEPGANPWRFDTDKPAMLPGRDTLRPVAFNLRNLVIRAVRRLERPAPPPADNGPGK
jgi:hypothetical protein